LCCRVFICSSHGISYVNTIAGYNAGDPNSAVVALWQVGSSTVANAVRVDLFSQIVNDKCYNQLRTKEQLGYLVWSGAQKDATYHAIGFRVIVQV
jgi:insulysin